jgi:hypothetical protein
MADEVASLRAEVADKAAAVERLRKEAAAITATHAAATASVRGRFALRGPVLMVASVVFSISLSHLPHTVCMACPSCVCTPE